MSALPSAGLCAAAAADWGCTSSSAAPVLTGMVSLFQLPERSPGAVEDEAD